MSDNRYSHSLSDVDALRIALFCRRYPLEYAKLPSANPKYSCVSENLIFPIEDMRCGYYSSDTMPTSPYKRKEFSRRHYDSKNKREYVWVPSEMEK